jgi:hypothetical protein
MSRESGVTSQKELSRGRMVYVRAKGKRTADRGGHWHDQVKTRSVQLVMAGKTSREVSMELRVPFHTIVKWRGEPWFKDMVKELQEDDGHQLDSQITQIMHTTLDVIQDRLKDGDHVRDDKTGKVVRVPVKIRDANNAFNTLMDKRQLIRKMPTKISDTSSVNQQLQVLANEFKKFLGHKIPAESITQVIEGEHVFINEDGTGEWMDKENDDAFTEEVNPREQV